MVHCAYDSCELVESCPTKIETVGSYGSKLLIGCTDGSLLVCQADASIIDRSASSDPGILNSEPRKDPYIVERELKGFFKKPLVAMEVLRFSELMLFLSDSISFHRLPSLETTAVITKSKGANAYSWDDRRGFLCFARQKRVCIFRHDGGRGFVEVKEFGVPDTVKSMAWCGENICLGIRREYTILNTTTGTLNEVFPSGRIAPPLVIPLPSGELLLGKDNIGVFVDHNGKLLQEGRICWSDAPIVVVIQKPYAVALLSRHIEVRSLRVPYQLVQTIALRNGIHLLQCTNAIVVALQNSIYGLFPVPLGAQIVQLTASGNFEEALALCQILPPEDEKLRTAKEGAIHLRYGHHLFEKGSYEDAMEHFLDSQVDIIHVLSLYPSIVLPRSNMISEFEKSEMVATDGPYLSRVLSGGSDDFDGSPSSQPSESDEIAALESKKLNHNTFMALIKFLHKKRSNIIDKAITEGTDEVILGTVGDMFMSYGSGRTKGSNKAKNISSIISGAREMAAILDTALLQALIFTGQMPLVTDLLKGINHCDIKICEDLLRKTNYYAALLELYKSNGNHREALKLLHHLVNESESGQTQIESVQKFNPEMILEYLKPLCGTDPMLVLEFSMLVLQSCPMKTIDLLLYGNIPADLVNSYLKEHAPGMQATYLELMLKVSENGISRNLQNEIVQIYFSDVIDWQADVASQNKWNEDLDCPSRKKLLNALETVPGYSPDALLRRLPTEALYQERAILLGKMNQHELALSIYVHRLNVPEMALSYCDRVHDAGINQAGIKSHRNIYLTLLQIYLNPGRTTKNFERRIANVVTSQSSVQKTSLKNKGARQSRKIAQIEGAEETRISPNETDSGRSDVDEVYGEGTATIMLDEILDLLGRRWERINGAQALKLLPKETKLQNLVSFLCPLLKKSSEAFRNFSVIKNLRQGENLQVKNSLYSLRKDVVKIENESMCSFCNKKIGTSVFAVYPNRETLVHFVCFRDSQNMKAVTGGSSLRKNR